jgi:hypothetical protein
MSSTWVFLRDVSASASGFPVPRAACCCSTPYHQNSLLLAPVREALFPDIDVDQRAADGLTFQSSAISGAMAEVKFP